MKRIETDRKFLVEPTDFLYYTKSGCDHSEQFGRMGRNMGFCNYCLSCLGTAEFIGSKAVFETDELTESKLMGVYYKGLFINAKDFKVIKEV